MKKHFTKFSICVISLFILTILGAGICAWLSYQQTISIEVNSIIMTVVSILLFLILAIICGGIVKRRGLLMGIALSLFYLLGVSLFLVIGHKEWDFQVTLRIAIRMLALVTGSVLGVNLSAKRT